MTRKTYWLTDGYGNKAYVEGADERDRWVARDWADGTEPEGEDQVWVQHADHKGKAQLPASAYEQWAGLGWQPAAPPEPVDLTKDPALVDVAAHQPAKAMKSAGAASGEQKGQTVG